VIWTVVIENRAWIRNLPFLIDKKFRGHGPVDHDHPAADDAVTGPWLATSGRFSLSAADRTVSTTWWPFLTGRDASSFQMLGDVTLSPLGLSSSSTPGCGTPYVMLICLAGLRSIPDYIFEAAEGRSRASKKNGGNSGRSRLADGAAVHQCSRYCFRGNRELQDVRHGQTCSPAAGRGSTTESRLDHAQAARAFRELADRLFPRPFAIILFRDGLRPSPTST